MRGRTGLPAFRKLTARGQLELNRESRSLLPWLLGRGLDPEDAVAVAYNAALLRRVLAAEPPLSSPMEVLERYPIGELAELCEAYRLVEAGELEYGGREAGA